MSISQGFKKGLLTAAGFSILALGLQLPAQAQTIDNAEFNNIDLNSTDLNVELANGTASDLLAADSELEAQSLTVEEEQLAYPVEETEELAQARRRTRGTVTSSNFIGLGADFGTADDVSFAVISKFAINDQVAIRPSVLIGNDFGVLVPVTYEFSQFAGNAGGFNVRPYAGAGASYIDANNSSEIGLLLSAGIDVPVSRRFTFNAQANYSGIFGDNENFGGTVGLGYNLNGFR